MDGNPDFKDLLRSLSDEGARYLVVGAYALVFYTEPRYTKDIDIWVEPTPDNAEKVWKALAAFGAPLADVTREDLCDPELVYQIGIEPNRVDILMGVAGLTFSEAWEGRVTSTYGGEAIQYLGREDLIRSKEAAGRPQDLRDAASLREAR